MKLIKLEILNLASLDKIGGEVINFEEGVLGKSSIFSIVGPMGSGKSTILDAICLALYNRAPRYPKKKGDRNQSIEIYGEPDTTEKNRLPPTDARNILTHGKKFGYSKLTFLANDGCVYRAEWSVAFKQKNYENAIKTLFKITYVGGKPVEKEADWEQLPNIIGLDYEQFLRTVLIAQGSFANFLTAKEDERYELLEKLVGCEETYSRIAREIKAKKDKAMEDFRNMNSSVAAIEQNKLSEEQLQQLQEEISQLEAMEKQLADTLQKVKESLQWYVDEDAKTASVKEQEAKLNKAKEALEQIKGDIEQLGLHDALEQAIDILRGTKRLESEIESLGSKISTSEAEIKRVEEREKQEEDLLRQLEQKAEEIKKLIEEKTPHIKLARELLTKISSADETVKERRQAKEEAEKEWKAAQKAVSDNEAKVKAAQDAVASAAKAMKETESKVTEQKEVLRVAVETARKALEEKKKEIEGKDADELQSHSTRSEKALADLETAVDVLGRLEKARQDKMTRKARQTELENRNKAIDTLLAPIDIETLRKEVETLQRSYTLMSSEAWAMHRSLLEKGQPCPLCGAVEHPYSDDTARFKAVETELDSLLKKKEQGLKENMEKFNQLNKEKEGNIREIESIRQRLVELDKEMSSLENQWNELLGQHPKFPQTKNELEALKPAFIKRCQEANAALKAFNRTQTEMATLTTQKEKAEKALSDYEETSRELMDKAKETCTHAETVLASTKAQTPNLTSQQTEKKAALDKAIEVWTAAKERLETFEKQFQAELDGEQPDAVEARLKKAKEDNENEVGMKKDSIVQLDGKRKEECGVLASLKEQCGQDRTQLESKKTELQQWMEDYNADEKRIKTIQITDIETISTVPNERWEAIRREKQVLGDAVVSATSLLESAKKALEEHQKIHPEKLREELTQERDELQSRGPNEALINARTRMKNHQDAVAQLGSNAVELDRLTKLKDDWTAITDAIGSDGKTLRKIAQCYTLGFLIEHANAEIRKFNSRYELLQVKHSLGIRVIDHDRADDVRDITSLSGGETFIVSLGLALGLSSLSSRNVSFENLFIDEGFGSLDPDTLSTVIDSLAMLQSKQGKKVGVISHTDTMSERITTQIRVIKKGNSGSSYIDFFPK